MLLRDKGAKRGYRFSRVSESVGLNLGWAAVLPVWFVVRSGVPAGWGIEPVLGCPGWFSSSPAASQLSLF